MSYLGNRDELDNRAFSNILRELINRQGSYYKNIKADYLELKKLASEGGNQAMSAVDYIENSTGLKIPIYQGKSKR